jgi:hypothetical protein
VARQREGHTSRFILCVQRAVDVELRGSKMRFIGRTFVEQLREAWACETCRRYRRVTLLLLGLLLATWFLA